MALLIAIAIVMAMLVSSYLSAYKTGQGVKSHTQTAIGNKAARKSAPSPTVMPQNASTPKVIFTQQQYPAAQAIQPPATIQEAMPQMPERPSGQPTPTVGPSAIPEPPAIKIPAMPNAPYMKGFDLIQQLYWIMAIISRQYLALPPWPVFWWP